MDILVIAIIGIILTSEPVSRGIEAMGSLPRFAWVLIATAVIAMIIIHKGGKAYRKERAKKQKEQERGYAAEERVEKLINEWIQHQKDHHNREFRLISKDCTPLPVEEKYETEAFAWTYRLYTRIKKVKPQEPKLCINLKNEKAARGASEIDHILVGSGLVLHVETKSFGGTVTIEDNNTWTRQLIKYNSPHPNKTTPEAQTKGHHLLLRKIVGQKAGVFGVICLAGDERAFVTGKAECLEFPIYPINDLWSFLDDLAASNNPVDRSSTEELIRVIDSYKVQRKEGISFSEAPSLSSSKIVSRPVDEKPDSLMVNYSFFQPPNGYKMGRMSFYCSGIYEENSLPVPYSWIKHTNIRSYGAYFVRERSLLQNKPKDYFPTSEDIINHPMAVYRGSKTKSAKYNPAKNAFEIELDCQKGHFWVVFVVEDCYGSGANQTGEPVQENTFRPVRIVVQSVQK